MCNPITDFNLIENLIGVLTAFNINLLNLVRLLFQLPSPNKILFLHIRKVESINFVKTKLISNGQPHSCVILWPSVTCHIVYTGEYFYGLWFQIPRCDGKCFRSIFFFHFVLAVASFIISSPFALKSILIKWNDEFIENKRKKVMKTWVMKNVTILQNIFISFSG